MISADECSEFGCWPIEEFQPILLTVGLMDPPNG
jgi:hypothetical protein